MSLRTPTEPSGQRTGQEAAEASLVPGLPMPEAVRSRIPISRVPQPREDRMISTWRLARPRRIAAALEASQQQNSGGWYVAGASTDVGRTESVARTIAGREVVLWRDAEGALVAGPPTVPAHRVLTGRTADHVASDAH